MTQPSKNFLKAAQRAGWHLVGVDETGAIGACPTPGCDVKVKLRPGHQIPETCRKDRQELVVEDYETIRQHLRNRREQLTLTIPEVEHIAGFTADHIAKAEKPEPSRQMKLDLLAMWARALGYEIVLRPVGLPDLALRLIEETRDKHAARRKSQSRS